LYVPTCELEVGLTKSFAGFPAVSVPPKALKSVDPSSITTW